MKGRVELAEDSGGDFFVALRFVAFVFSLCALLGDARCNRQACLVKRSGALR